VSSEYTIAGPAQHGFKIEQAFYIIIDHEDAGRDHICAPFFSLPIGNKFSMVSGSVGEERCQSFS
jgi:hypothetical protein